MVAEIREASAKMTPEQRMEQFSFAYVRAVAAHAGCAVTDNLYPDLNSRDGSISADWGRRPQIDFQAKATAQDVLRDGEIRFPLPIGDYNNLRRRDTVPHILIALLMPKDESDWLTQTADELMMRRCAYWMSLEGMRPRANVSTVTVYVPISQMFDGAQLRGIMDKVDRGEDL